MSQLVRDKLARISTDYPEDNWSVSILSDEGRRDCEQRGNCSDVSEGYSPSLMIKEMAEATFCLIPMGDTPNSQRLFLAIAANCIPVIIARWYDTYSGEPVWYAPFQDLIDWSKFAIFVDPIEFVESDDRYLPDMLQSIASDTTRVAEMLRRVSDVIPHLTFEAPGSDIEKYALVSAKRHCLSRPLERLPTPAERVEHEQAGVLWAYHNDTSSPWEWEYLVDADTAAARKAVMCKHLDC